MNYIDYICIVLILTGFLNHLDNLNRFRLSNSIYIDNLVLG